MSVGDNGFDFGTFTTVILVTFWLLIEFPTDLELSSGTIIVVIGLFSKLLADKFESVELFSAAINEA